MGKISDFIVYGLHMYERLRGNWVYLFSPVMALLWHNQLTNDQQLSFFKRIKTISFDFQFRGAISYYSAQMGHAGTLKNIAS